ncbi:MAG: hypothetical protein KDD94_09055 [Calditrichaeota bacterium]|nr:hypothetical protein [Calditrichota bacterium]
MRQLLTVLLLSSALLAGGWNQKQGTIFAKYEFRWINAKKGFNLSGDVVDLGFDYGSVTHSVYLEYGLLDQLTLISNVPFARSFEFGSAKFSGFADINLGARYGFDQEGPTVFAAIVNFSMETGEKSKLTSIGGSAIQIGLEIGHSLHEIGAYTTAYIAYNARNGSGIQNELNIGAEFGYQFATDFWGIVKLRNVTVLDDLSPFVPPQFQSEYMAFALEAAYNLTEELGVTAAFDGAFAAKNNYAAPTFAIGIFYKSL